MVAFATFLNKLNYYLLSVFYVLFPITLAPLESDIVVGEGATKGGLLKATGTIGVRRKFMGAATFGGEKF